MEKCLTQLDNAQSWIDLLKELAITTASNQDFESTLSEAVSLIARHAGWPVGHVYRSDGETRLIPTDIWYLEDARFEPFREITMRTPLEAGVGLPGRAMQRGKPVWIADVVADTNFPRRPAAAQLGLHAALALPVMPHGRCAAVLEFFTGESLDPGDGALDLSAHASVLLTRVAERSQSEQALRERDQLLSDLERLAHIGTWRWEVNGNRVHWSDELYRIYGLERTAFPATFEGYLERVHPDDRAKVKTALGNALQSADAFDFEERIVRPTGELRVLRSRGTVQRDATGAPVRLQGSCHDVTEMRDAAAKAEQASRELQLILDTVDEGIYGLDLNGRTTFLNQAAAQLLGWDPPDLLGAPQHERIHHSHRDGSRYRLEDCPIHRVLTTSVTERVRDEVFWRKDGTAIEVSYTAAPLVQHGTTVGVVVTFVDLSERRRTEQEAQRALLELVREQAARAEAESMRSQLNRIFEQAPAVVALTTGPDHVFDLANPRYRELVGQREMIGKPVREALPEVVEQGFLDLLDMVYRTGEPYVGQEVPAVIQRDNAATYEGYFNFVYQPLVSAAGTVYGILIHAVEVTEQVRARQEVERKAAELALLTQELERTNRELDQFAYIASHDLKAPLRGVSNITSWLEEDLGGRLSGETLEYMRLMKERVARMENLINALLDYSRAGRVRGEPQPVELQRLVRDVVELVAVPDHLEVAIADGLPRIMADPIAIQQVFQNLISNAAKYATSKIEIGCRELAGDYEFYVRDDGPGIEPRYHDRIWGMFQRLHAPGEGDGTGVGLAIVKKVTDAYGGSVTVESELGAGATFRLKWPKQQGEEFLDGAA